MKKDKMENPLKELDASKNPDNKSIEEIKEDMKELCVGVEVAPEVQKINTDVETIRQHSNIPKRYREAKLEAINEKQENLVSILRENLSGKNPKDIRDILIIGTVGTGKTHIVMGALNSLINQGVWCKYATEYDLLDMYFRKTKANPIDKNSEPYSKFDGFRQAKILVIDEIGKRELIDWQKIQIEELISYRYNEMLPTIFITNLNTKEFKKFVGDRVSDRLRDNNIIRVLLDGESLRGNNV